MRTPVDYGDNFPVPFESWSPSMPWSFPQYQVSLRKVSLARQIVPWLMLGIGIAVGIGWMNWKMTGEGMRSANMGFVDSQKLGEQSIRVSPSRGAQPSLKKNPHSALKVKSRLA